MNKKIVLLVAGLLVVVTLGPIAALSASAAATIPGADYSSIIAAIDRLTAKVDKVSAMQGPQGAPGSAGATGPTGATGATGATVHFGAWREIDYDYTKYSYRETAETDGFVMAYCRGTGSVQGFIHTHIIMADTVPLPPEGELFVTASITMPVRQGEEWMVIWSCPDPILYWLPLTS